MNLIVLCLTCRLLENGAKLQIEAAHLSDAGSYTCQMSNVAGRVNLTYQVDVFSNENLNGFRFIPIIVMMFFSTTDN